MLITCGHLGIKLMTVFEELVRRLNPEALELFYRICIGELSDIDVDDAEETVADIFKRYAAVQLEEKTLSLGCKSFADLIVPVNDPSIDQTLAKLLRPHFDDCEEFGLPTSAEKMRSLDLIGLLVYPGEIGFVDADLSIQLWGLSCGELDFVGNPENHIVSFQPMLTFDLYGNLLGYTPMGW